MKKRKRHWYQDIYWEHLPYAIIDLIFRNIKLIIYVLSISFVLYQVGKLSMTTECSSNIQEILQAENKAKSDAEIARLKELQYQREAESRERERQEEENAMYNKTLEQKHNTEMTKKIYPKGTYLRNKITNEVGQVKEIQGERVITTTFYFDAINCLVNEDVEYLSYNEYKRAVEKELQNKKLTNEEIRQRQEWLKECEEKDTEETKKIWKVNDCFKYQGAMYEVKEIKGTTLICYKAGTKSKSVKRFKYEVYAYAEGIERIDGHEFIRLS